MKIYSNFRLINPKKLLILDSKNTFKEEIDKLLITLLLNGYHLKKVFRISPNSTIINVYKYDYLGAEIRYSILISSKKPSTSILTRLDKIAGKTNFNSYKIAIGKEEIPDVTFYLIEDFYKKIGGATNFGLVLHPELPEILNQLGHNKLPKNFSGSPDDLLEAYCKECLQFILKVPVRRYGKDRSFESLPDGLVIGDNSFVMLFDAKAYRNGFAFESDDINRFEKYVKEFRAKYGHFFPNIHSFLVISSQFNDSEKSIQNRSDDLFSRCYTRLTCIKADELGEIAQLIIENSKFRQSINWKRQFSKLYLSPKEIKQEISKLKKDKVIS